VFLQRAVFVSLCICNTPPEAAARFKVLFGVETLGGQRNIVLGVVPASPVYSVWPLPNYFGHLLRARQLRCEQVLFLPAENLKSYWLEIDVTW